MLNVIGALVLAYFVSRGLRLLGMRGSVIRLLGAHLVSFGIIAGIAVLMREPLDVLYASHILTYLFAQAVWLLLDLYRARVAFWKPPVAATGTSPTTRAGSSL